MPVFFATAVAHRSLTADDQLAVQALKQLHIEARPLVWTETEPSALPNGSTIILRSVWDYHLRSEEFLAWVSRAEAHGATLINKPSTILWNMDKRYLSELARAGVSTIPTERVRRGSATSLANILGMRGWVRAVVKPAISASAFETWRVGREADGTTTSDDEERFVNLVAQRDVMVQPYVPEIETAGEWSIIFIDGAYSHSVIKHPAAGDFRVQEDYGGTRKRVTPSLHLITAAHRALDCVPGRPLYARIDGVETADGFMLMEAECIDPVLFFSFDERAATRFAESISRYSESAMAREDKHSATAHSTTT